MFRFVRKVDKTYLRYGPNALTSPIGRRNEYLKPIRRFPTPNEVNKLIDNRADYDDTYFPGNVSNK